ncbi:MAG: hypothetical protein HZA17_09180, partial [Nitrospirae bacterium]|nr:hypothetical protein [Nitrospirota bacterium]
AAGRFAAVWSPVTADEGEHVISLRAGDYAGNISRSFSTAITVDLTRPEPPVILSPMDNTGLVSGTPTIRGISESGARVTMNSMSSITLTEASLSGEFSFDSVKLAPGKNTLTFIAADRAGNVSGPRSHTLYFTPVSAVVSTDRQIYNTDEAVTIRSYIKNVSSDYPYPHLTARISLANSRGEKLFTEQKTVSMVAPGETIEFRTAWNTGKREKGIYTIKFEVIDESTVQSSATTSFEIKPEASRPSVEATQSVSDVTNVLVWINEGCHKEERGGESGRSESRCDKEHDKERGDERCLRSDLLEALLNDAATSYYIVRDADGFSGEMRNPYYTDMLIIGDHHGLEGHIKDELREKVYSGTGIISSLWSGRGDDSDDGDDAADPVFGIKYRGRFPGAEHVVHTAESLISAEGAFDVYGSMKKIEAGEDVIIAGWTEARKGREGDRDREDNDDEEEYSEYPAMTIKQYGKGRAIYLAFDLGSTLNDETYAHLSEIIKKSIAYVHKSHDTKAFSPYALVPLELKLTGLERASELRIYETYPVEFKLYDPLEGKWLTGNTRIMNLHIAPDETKNILSYALMPDRPGTYTLQTDIGYIEDSAYVSLRKLTTQLSVKQDCKTMVSEVIGMLKALKVSGRDKAKVRAIIRQVEAISRGTAVTRNDIGRNITEMVNAVNSLLALDNAGIDEIRLIMDSLIKAWAGQYSNM